MIDQISVPCQCKDSPFKNQDHGHISTENLKIVSNKKLCSIFLKGPKYTEPQILNFKQARENMVNGIDDCIAAWCQRKGFAYAVLHQWKIKVIKLIDDRITTLKSTLNNYSKNNVSKKRTMFSIH